MIKHNSCKLVEAVTDHDERKSIMEQYYKGATIEASDIGREENWVTVPKPEWRWEVYAYRAVSSNSPFWIVWTPDGMNPKVKHSSYEKAVREAERLAALSTERSFFVLRAESVSRVSNVVTTKL